MAAWGCASPGHVLAAQLLLPSPALWHQEWEGWPCCHWGVTDSHRMLVLEGVPGSCSLGTTAAVSLLSVLSPETLSSGTDGELRPSFLITNNTFPGSFLLFPHPLYACTAFLLHLLIPFVASLALQSWRLGLLPGGDGSCTQLLFVSMAPPAEAGTRSCMAVCTKAVCASVWDKK